MTRDDDNNNNNNNNNNFLKLIAKEAFLLLLNAVIMEKVRVTVSDTIYLNIQIILIQLSFLYLIL